MAEPEFHVRTDLEEREVTGADTMICSIPTGFYADVGQGPALLMQPFARWLRKISEEAAANLDEKLHHADFVLTTSRATVEARGKIHDCDQCRAGVRAALRRLKEKPNEELLVGTLYWAGSGKPRVEV